MSSSRVRSPVVLLALVACACSATARGIGTATTPARQTSVTTDVVYGHKDGLALTFDVHRPAQPNGAGGQLAPLLGTTADSGDPNWQRS
jgi:hypothetical protein